MQMPAYTCPLHVQDLHTLTGKSLPRMFMPWGSIIHVAWGEGVSLCKSICMCVCLTMHSDVHHDAARGLPVRVCGALSVHVCLHTYT